MYDVYVCTFEGYFFWGGGEMKRGWDGLWRIDEHQKNSKILYK